MKMEAHLEVRRDTDIWKFLDRTVVQPLLTSGLLKNLPIEVDAEMVQKICGIFDVNGFEIRSAMALKGLATNGFNISGIYPRSALLAHDCTGNTLVAIDAEYNMKIFASQLIKTDETIYFNYTRSLMNTADRQIHLKEGKYFECCCKRCLDPTEFGTHLSSIKCKECPDGLLVSNKKINWICLKCEKTVESDVIDKLLLEVKSDMFEIGMDLRLLEQACAKYSCILNPNHSYVIEMKQNIAGLLRDQCVLSHHPPSRSILRRKFEVCNTLLPIVRKLEPGLSRLVGITLYEIYVPMVQLAQRDFEALELQSPQLLVSRKFREFYFSVFNLIFISHNRQYLLTPSQC